MSSRFYPSLLSALWAELPLPEWLPGATDPVWQQTITALTQLWREAGQFGLVVSSPVPWLPTWEWHWQPEWQVESPISSQPTDPQEKLQRQRWLFTSDLSPAMVFDPGQTVIPVLPKDPLAEERFLLLTTPVFSALVAQGQHPSTGQMGMMISFEPEVLQRAMNGLQMRLQQVRPDCFERWQSAWAEFPLLVPHHRVMSRYSSLLLMAGMPLGTVPQLPAVTDPLSLQPAYGHRASGSGQELSLHSQMLLQPAVKQEQAEIKDGAEDPGISEVELLRALIHEVKTPLATIRTLVRLLLRRSDLPAVVLKHLEQIDRECTEQIDRFSLFFQATELDSPQFLQLEPIALVDLLQQNLADWQDQVARRGSTLDFVIPNDLPDVVSDPKTLDAVLSGLIDRIARSSPPGSTITAQLVNAGEQVKLQFQVNVDPAMGIDVMEPQQAIGQLLMLQPDTGAISLSLPVTRTLFRALGGHLTVRQKAHQGEIVTIYLPRQL